ncbi:hypothetical protein ACE38W_14445 [Chitinophaga sp. Hz27]
MQQLGMKCFVADMMGEKFCLPTHVVESRDQLKKVNIVQNKKGPLPGAF